MQRGEAGRVKSHRSTSPTRFFHAFQPYAYWPWSGARRRGLGHRAGPKYARASFDRTRSAAGNGIGATGDGAGPEAEDAPAPGHDADGQPFRYVHGLDDPDHARPGRLRGASGNRADPRSRPEDRLVEGRSRSAAPASYRHERGHAEG